MKILVSYRPASRSWTISSVTWPFRRPAAASRPTGPSVWPRVPALYIPSAATTAASRRSPVISARPKSLSFGPHFRQSSTFLNAKPAKPGFQFGGVLAAVRNVGVEIIGGLSQLPETLSSLQLRKSFLSQVDLLVDRYGKIPNNLRLSPSVPPLSVMPRPGAQHRDYRSGRPLERGPSSSCRSGNERCRACGRSPCHPPSPPR